MPEVKKCLFCDKPRDEKIRFFGLGDTLICADCVRVLHRSLMGRTASEFPLQKGLARFFCDFCGTEYSHAACPYCKGVLSLAEDPIDLLSRGYSGLAQKTMEGHFPGKKFSIRVHLRDEDGALHRSVKVGLAGRLLDEERDAVSFLVGRGMNLAGSDLLEVGPESFLEVFRAPLPSGRLWVLRLLGITPEEAEMLLKWQAQSYDRPGDARDGKNLPPQIKGLFKTALRDHIDHFANAAVTYRYALVMSLSGYFDMCRHMLLYSTQDHALQADMANLLAMIETEDQSGKLIPAAEQILRYSISSTTADAAGKQILRYNLARLLEEKEDLRGAEALYQEIFEQDWYFLDVRERLRSLTPERIAKSLCSRNIRMLADNAMSWHQDRGALPETLNDLVREYISSLPSCPVSHKEYHYHREKSGFTIYCEGAHHTDCGLAENEPSFDSGAGPGNGNLPRSSEEKKSRRKVTAKKAPSTSKKARKKKN